MFSFVLGLNQCLSRAFKVFYRVKNKEKVCFLVTDLF